MFDISFLELLLILLVALLVIGPERLPGVARTLGYWAGRARGTVNSLRRDIERETRVDEFRKAERAFRRDLETELKEDVEPRAPEAPAEPVSAPASKPAPSEPAPESGGSAARAAAPRSPAPPPRRGRRSIADDAAPEPAPARDGARQTRGGGDDGGT